MANDVLDLGNRGAYRRDPGSDGERRRAGPDAYVGKLGALCKLGSCSSLGVVTERLDSLLERCHA